MKLTTFVFTVWNYGFEDMKVTTNNEDVLKYYINRLRPFKVFYLDENGKEHTVYDCPGSSIRGVSCDQLDIGSIR